MVLLESIPTYQPCANVRITGLQHAVVIHDSSPSILLCQTTKWLSVGVSNIFGPVDTHEKVFLLFATRLIYFEGSCMI